MTVDIHIALDETGRDGDLFRDGTSVLFNDGDVSFIVRDPAVGRKFAELIIVAARMRELELLDIAAVEGAKSEI